MAKASIFSDFLQALGVQHTGRYSDSRFNGLTFKSLFGLSRLLDEYGVENSAWRVPVRAASGIFHYHFWLRNPIIL